ncbi:hypothetical protein GCM10022261_07640 [Brevibacterium daeguense]|uniref:Putative Flp pilus-assembly TadG-like N-terminal domain-containing protein n=1 Tax=Brevibacterium daeguense TaxID=909936 RepID=A0ABP8EGZ3_9MICO|nr:Tad domain-containing protein [Brevibacterium daeguense]
MKDFGYTAWGGVRGWARGSDLTDDEGSISPVLPIMALVILLLGALVVDSGRQLDLRARAIAYAQEGARAGASQIDPTRTDLVLIPEQVSQQVTVYCEEIEQRADVESCVYLGIQEDPEDENKPLIVKVSVDMKTPASLLNMVGVRELTASGEGQARPFQGVREVNDQPDSGYEPDPDSEIPEDGSPPGGQPGPGGAGGPGGPGAPGGPDGQGGPRDQDGPGAPDDPGAPGGQAGQDSTGDQDGTAPRLGN